MGVPSIPSGNGHGTACPDILDPGEGLTAPPRWSTGWVSARRGVSPETRGVDLNGISDFSSADVKAASGDMTLAGLDATDTASVWDDNKSVNYQHPCWRPI